jgi:hypothetical protein
MVDFDVFDTDKADIESVGEYIIYPLFPLQSFKHEGIR